jgi:tRNA(Ile)-lysidine synthase
MSIVFMPRHPSKNSYAERFFFHVTQFMQRYEKKKGVSFYSLKNTLVLAVSGGVDSVSLVYLAHYLRQKFLIKDCLILHVNHQTRLEENVREQDLVQKLAEKFQMPCLVKTLPSYNSKIHGNFEHWARKERYLFFSQQMKPGDFLWTGHHLDDSWEWSLAQQLKGVTGFQSFGIPLVSQSIRRPFLCVSKKQIYRLAFELSMNFYEDSSNKDLQWERNTIRHCIRPPIEARFPFFLKQYARWANESWEKEQQRLRLLKQHQKQIFQDQFGIFCYHQQTFSLDGTDSLLKIVSGLSQRSLSRGVLRRPLQQLLTSMHGQKSGPHHFSGGVRGMAYGTYLGLFRDSTIQRILDQDLKMSFLFERFVSGEKDLFPIFEGNGVDLAHYFSKNLHQVNHQVNKKNSFFPFWVASPQKKILDCWLPSLKKKDSLWPLLTQLFVEKEWWFRSLGEIDYHLRKKGRKNLPDGLFSEKSFFLWMGPSL